MQHTALATLYGRNRFSREVRKPSRGSKPKAGNLLDEYSKKRSRKAATGHSDDETGDRQEFGEVQQHYNDHFDMPMEYGDYYFFEEDLPDAEQVEVADTDQPAAEMINEEEMKIEIDDAPLPAQVAELLKDFDYPKIVPSYEVNKEIEQLIAQQACKLAIRNKNLADDPPVCEGSAVTRAEFAVRMKSIAQRYNASPALSDDIMMLIVESFYHKKDVNLPVRLTQRKFVRSDIDSYTASDGMQSLLKFHLCPLGNCTQRILFRLLS